MIDDHHVSPGTVGPREDEGLLGIPEDPKGEVRFPEQAKSGSPQILPKVWFYCGICAIFSDGRFW